MSLGLGYNVAKPSLYASLAISTAILTDISRISFKRGYILPSSRFFCVIDAATRRAAIRKYFDLICLILNKQTANPIEGKI
uniref:G_PROTEIN_RECEP_F1_2 domain-containing protein n=1 Tax=Strongyloides stercoralis TaxID=6248 RepID=A0A0K0DVT8_STRER